MVNFERNQSNNPADNAWDMSDVQFNDSDTFMIPDRGYDFAAAHEYEKRERALQDELFRISERRAGILSNAGDELTELVKKNSDELADKRGDEFAGKISVSVDDIISGKKATSRATLESLFGYIDAMYPSPYAEKVLNKNQVADAEDSFRNMSYRESTNTADNIKKLAECLTYDGSDNDLYIANHLDHIGTGAFSYHKDLARAIIAYAEDPSKEKRASINSVQAEHERTLANSLFGIADIFSDSRTEVGRKMFDPTVYLEVSLATNDEDYIVGIMDYLKFKIGNTDDNDPIKAENDRDDLKPDVFLS